MGYRDLPSAFEVQKEDNRRRFVHVVQGVWKIELQFRVSKVVQKVLFSLMDLNFVVATTNQHVV